MSTWKGVAPSVGLLIAWGGTALLVSPAAGFFGDPASIVTQCLGQAALWLLLAAILGIVVFWEKQPLASLWRRDLLAMIIAHVAIDAWSLVVTPSLSSEWWR